MTQLDSGLLCPIQSQTLIRALLCSQLHCVLQLYMHVHSAKGLAI